MKTCFHGDEGSSAQQEEIGPEELFAHDISLIESVDQRLSAVMGPTQTESCLRGEHRPLESYRRVLSNVKRMVERTNSVQEATSALVSREVLSKREWESLLRLCLQSQDPHSAELALDLMKETGTEVTETHINTVLECHVEQADHVGFENSLERHVTGVPTKDQRHLHIKVHLNASPPETIPTAALSILHDYENQLAPPAIQSYSKVIKHLFSIPTATAQAHAWDLFSHMRYVAHPDPDIVMYTQMIRACASFYTASRQADPERALDLWHEMTVDKRHKPTTGTYNAVILACARSGRKSYVNEAFRLAKEMLDSNRDAYGRPAYAPDLGTFKALLEGARRIGDSARVRWILAEMIGGKSMLKSTYSKPGNQPYYERRLHLGYGGSLPKLLDTELYIKHFADNHRRSRIMANIFKPAPPPPTKLGVYRTFSSQAGVRLSPLCLGAMSIGDKWNDTMGQMDRESSIKLLNAYFDMGGNFIDTANVYQEEASEEILGEWMENRGIRDQLFIATKYTIPFKRSDPKIIQKVNYMGNNAKSMHISVEHSLKKLRTSYIDLLYVHFWDFETSVKEVMDNLHHLVASGKVIYLGISNAPAWVVSQANQYALDNGKTPFCVYQARWNVIERSVERDILPMARAFGMAIAPYAVLGGGRLRTDAEEQRRKESGEKGRTVHSAQWERTDAEVKMSRALEKVAQDLGAKSMTSVAIAYVMQKTPYVFPIIGGRKVENLVSNLEALDLTLTDNQIAYLESIIPVDLGYPHTTVNDKEITYVIKSAAHTQRMPPRQPLRPTSDQ
ncbi:aryl-alcohol dehydrogenase [Moniliophthora roreri MCA 2997]|uniref:Aryl-alcohol dehydrogenase n=1 Tax=Moniliophthora roreri (strain MCA 2997) TaxID=1381753 RepID=V2WCZ8_MONRO|nr:aryl-alcohol dehydrogenase [Moniliophthora roreri MCA 2997]